MEYDVTARHGSCQRGAIEQAARRYFGALFSQPGGIVWATRQTAHLHAFGQQAFGQMSADKTCDSCDSYQHDEILGTERGIGRLRGRAPWGRAGNVIIRLNMWIGPFFGERSNLNHLAKSDRLDLSPKKGPIKIIRVVLRASTRRQP